MRNFIFFILAIAFLGMFLTEQSIAAERAEFGPPASAAGSGNCPSGFAPLVVGGGVCYPTETGLPDNASGDGIVLFFTKIMQWLLGIFGFIAISAFVVAGIMFLTSTGDETRATAAKKYMMYAIIGVVVGLSGVVVLRIVEDAFGGVSGTAATGATALGGTGEPSLGTKIGTAVRNGVSAVKAIPGKVRDFVSDVKGGATKSTFIWAPTLSFTNAGRGSGGGGGSGGATA